MSELRTELDIIGAENEILKKEVDTLKNDFKKQSEVLRDTKEQFASLDKKITDSIKVANNNEQYSWRFSLRIHGVMAQDNENCAREALNIFKHKLNLKDITVNDIEVAHRVGKPLRGKPQCLIVNFVM